MAGKIKFVKRGQSLAATIQEADLAAHEWGSDVPSPVDKVRAQDLELPHEVNVLYINSGADYQQGTQKSERQTGSGVSVMTIPLPVVMSDTKAKQVADVNHYNAWVGRTTYSLQLSRKWSKLEPTDVIDVVYGTTTFRMRITKKDDAKPGIIKLECVAEDSAIYTQSGVGAGASNIPVQAVTIPVQTLVMLMDIPMLRDDDNDAGVYFAACGYRTGWDGCALFKSADEGATYSNMFSVSTEAAIGNATTILGNFYGGNVFDELNTVTVRMIAGSLSSISELLVLNGGNYALLGNELIQFKNAELISANTYKLSGLLRGRRGTEWAMGAHDIGDRFILASTSTWRRIQLQSSDIGVNRLYKAVSFGMTLQQTAAIPLISTGMALECYSPIEAGAGRDSSGNITIKWKRRNRINSEWRDYVDVPMSESTESYEIDIYDSTFTTVLRTITATSETASYTAAQQTTDFGLLQNRVYVKIYQLSAVVGRGFPLTTTIEMGRVAHLSTKWRVYITDLQGTAPSWYPLIREIEMTNVIGGSDLCTGGTATADVNSVNAYKAFDDTYGTWWSGSAYSLPSWIQYEFTTSVDIAQFSMQVGNITDLAPKDFALQYYDGANWQSVYLATNQVWTADETKTFII